MPDTHKRGRGRPSRTAMGKPPLVTISLHVEPEVDEAFRTARLAAGISGPQLLAKLLAGPSNESRGSYSPPPNALPPPRPPSGSSCAEPSTGDAVASE